ncbi:MAG: bifunctional adenosylcobinamide kinase/adenosylcobinamide-phosphate guanylyltransferase [Pseudomonadota bacterium]
MSAALPAVTLVLGGVRSGKSAYGEELALSQTGPCLYLATAEAGDQEMAARIARHKARRGARWRTVEEPLELVEALGRAEAGAVLVDCLTLWLANLLGAGRDPEQEGDKLAAALPGLAAPVIFVSNEVGLGVIPDNKLAREFVDRAGRLHQKLAREAQAVVFMVAGQPLHVKSIH